MVRNRLRHWNKRQHTWDWNLEELPKKGLEDSRGGRSNLTSTLLDKMPSTRPSPSLSGWMAINASFPAFSKKASAGLHFVFNPRMYAVIAPKM